MCYCFSVGYLYTYWKVVEMFDPKVGNPFRFMIAFYDCDGEQR